MAQAVFQKFNEWLAVYLIEGKRQEKSPHRNSENEREPERQKNIQKKNDGASAEHIQKLLQGQGPKNFVFHLYELRNLELSNSTDSL